MIMLAFSLALALSLQDAPAPDTPPVIDAAPADEAAPDAAPQTRSSRDSLPRRLDERLGALGATQSSDEAEPIAAQIRSLWRQLGGPTAALLLDRGAESAARGELGDASRQYFHLRNLEPELSEAWMVSAEIAIAQDDWEFALEALERAVAIEPRRFDAYVMLARALERADAAQGALAAYEAALAIHPHEETALNGQARLERALAGRAL
ncbi:MAG: hypothetical protein AAFX09_06270 [Pseudomonadota bacterium]